MSWSEEPQIEWDYTVVKLEEIGYVYEEKFEYLVENFHPYLDFNGGNHGWQFRKGEEEREKLRWKISGNLKPKLKPRSVEEQEESFF